ncbi:hypothetical protein [Aquimarina rubra]|uniref:DUF306 domain-containing protein n=1 Tax=Aquimarina rubra TaxID=1920033 RepID=A0ABW5LBB1_9FLAO
MKKVNYSILILLALVLLAFRNNDLQPKLIKYQSSECLNENVYKIKRKWSNKLISKKVVGDIQIYAISILTNCNLTSKGDIELRKDTLNLKYDGLYELDKTYSEKENDSTVLIVEEYTQVLADCDCIFNLKYSIKGLENKQYVIEANGKLLNKKNNR